MKKRTNFLEHSFAFFFQLCYNEKNYFGSRMEVLWLTERLRKNKQKF